MTLIFNEIYSFAFSHSCVADVIWIINVNDDYRHCNSFEAILIFLFFFSKANDIHTQCIHRNTNGNSSKKISLNRTANEHETHSLFHLKTNQLTYVCSRLTNISNCFSIAMHNTLCLIASLNSNIMQMQMLNWGILSLSLSFSSSVCECVSLLLLLLLFFVVSPRWIISDGIFFLYLSLCLSFCVYWLTQVVLSVCGLMLLLFKISEEVHSSFRARSPKGFVQKTVTL